jgi:uncharacterized protein (TIGR03089 family)
VTASTPAALLEAAVRRDATRPLITYYDDPTGERTELSVATFANWVAKTANLLQDELAMTAGSRVRVQLPLHWQGAVWLQACWAAGLAVVLDGTGPADLAVVAHEQGRADAAEVVSLGLGPMGLPRPGAAPACARALDYDRVVHGHGDRFVPAGPSMPDAPALVVSGRSATAASIAAAARSAQPDGALLVTAAPTTPALALAVTLVPIVSGVTTVLVRHPDADRLAAKVSQEHLVAAVGDPTGALPEWRPGEPGMT